MSQGNNNHNKLPKIVRFALGAGFVVHVTFDDGSVRTIDLEPILTGPMFGELRDRGMFRMVRLNQDFGALEWPNGADIDPAVLHDWPNQVGRIVDQHRNLFAVSV